MEVGMPIIDTPYHEESKDAELDPDMKIIASILSIYRRCAQPSNIAGADGARAGQERDLT